MRKILRNILITFLILAGTSQFYVGDSYAADPNSYTTFRSVDKDSFNEYRYLITKEFFNIKSRWDVDGILDSASLARLKDLSSRGFNYLPDNNLENENLLNNLNTAIAKSLKYKTSDAAYTGLIKAIGAYLDESSIKSISGTVEALPKSGNAPFNVTLRSNITDPTGTTIPKYNYTWWIDLGSKKVNIGTGPSINYTFKEEGNFTVFLSVTSAHKNSKGYTDVIPYEDKVEIKVKEKVASLIIKVNGDRLGTRNVLKFTPSQAKYGLLFDATSSTPTGSAKFTRTQWDFDNGVKKSYSGDPKIERIVYNKEGDYEVNLKLKTNLGKEIEKDFTISIHDPIATINVNPSEGYLGDKFTFSANNIINDDNLTYNWTIVDIINDKVIFSKQTKAFTYNFPSKGHFNVKLVVDGIDSGESNIDTRNIYINSRAPVAAFSSTIPEQNKPNRVLLDATNSFDPDFTDTGKLKYYWEIDGARVKLEDANENGSLGYFTFTSIGDHNVVLKVEDIDNIKGIKKDKVTISSVLSVDFSTNPRAIKRGDTIKFEASSPNAKFYEWDFGDGNVKKGGVEDKISHKYEKTGIFDVKLKVIDDSGKSNTHHKVVYVGNGEKPVAILNIGNNVNNVPIEKGVCNGNDAYILDRINPLSLDAGESIDIDGKTNGLKYSVKVGNTKYFTTRNVSYKFDELGCFPIVLTVTSAINNSTDVKRVWVKVKNLEPTLSSITTSVENIETDPVVVTVNAVGANDKDGVITSYLWYYYTDLDNEPQDFRATTGPSTKFVLPKITGNYYFVTLLTDDSEARVSSEELGKKASITLAGNNINVPILELKVPDNSVHVFDEVSFNSRVQNILKQDISKKVKYFWDFDGDGFYDSETKTPSITHIYEKPGTFYAKLKVKYKGFSNTRNVEINVANSLIPDFDYVSIGNKFIFINKTKGSYENISFDLGDGTKIKDKDYFEHTYKDSKSSHKIKVIASDGNTVKKEEKKVIKNIQNLLKSKKSSDGVLFSIPESDSSNTIEIEKRVENISIYFSGKDFGEIGADLDLEKDSDLNGGKDDDNDVVSKDTYLNIDLNKNKTQLIRVFVKDSDSKTIVSKDYKIVKKYIKDEDINLDKVVFEGVTDAQKQKLEELKNLVSSISGDDSRLAKTYVSRLKDEWNDENERTKIIYEFDGFLNDSQIQNKDEISEKLQELLLKENDENNIKNIAFRALQGSTPSNVECEFDSNEYKSCKEYIDSSLDAIRSNDDVEQNKILGGTILDIIGKDTSLSTEEKLNYKATLQNLIYGGVENIPKEKVNEVINDNNSSDGSLISSILKTIGYIVLGILLLLAFGMGGFFLYQKIFSKDSDKSLKEFIAEKTDVKKDDIFSDNKDEKKDDIFAEEKVINKEKSPKSVSTKGKEVATDLGNKEIKEVKKEEPKIETKPEDVPDWLKGNFEEPKKEVKEPKKEVKEVKKEVKEPKKEVKEVKKEVKELKKEEPKVTKQEVKKDIVKDSKKEESLEEITKVDDDNIPDWLKGSLDETPKKEENSSSQSFPKKEQEAIKEVKKEDNIPDWLKGSLDEKPKKSSSQPSSKDDKEKEQVQKKEVKNKVKTEKKVESKKVETKKIEAKKEQPKKVESKKVEKKKIEPKKVEEKKIETTKKSPIKTEKKVDKKPELKKEVKPKAKDKNETKKDSSDLWDDGMDIPDWLKN